MDYDTHYHMTSYEQIDYLSIKEDMGFKKICLYEIGKIAVLACVISLCA